jgi:hypothetical protein
MRDEGARDRAATDPWEGTLRQNASMSSLSASRTSKRSGKTGVESLLRALANAAAASEGRLARVETVVKSMVDAEEVRAALAALRSNLQRMAEEERGLAERANSSGGEALVPQLEQQQRARAQWEERLQQQLEAIKGLQAASRQASQQSTPKRPPLGTEASTPSRLQAAAAALEGRGAGNRPGVVVPRGAHPQSMLSPDWVPGATMTSDSEDGYRRLSRSPLVEYSEGDSPLERIRRGFGRDEGQSRGQGVGYRDVVKRKLQLSGEGASRLVAEERSRIQQGARALKDEKARLQLKIQELALRHVAAGESDEDTRNIAVDLEHAKGELVIVERKLTISESS